MARKRPRSPPPPSRGGDDGDADGDEEELELRLGLGPAPAAPAVLRRPRAPPAVALLVLAHGAGAGMRHEFLHSLARLLARAGVATLRWDFPYMAAGRRFPDPPAVLRSAVRSAAAAAATLAPDLPCFVGGKSMGGRVASLLAAADDLPPHVRGLVLLGYPLRPPGSPADAPLDPARVVHLRAVRVPALYVQGDRDALTDLALLRPALRLGAGDTLLVERGADHGFGVLKRSGRTNDDVLRSIADAVSDWIRDQLRDPAG